MTNACLEVGINQRLAYYIMSLVEALFYWVALFQDVSSAMDYSMQSMDHGSPWCTGSTAPTASNSIIVGAVASCPLPMTLVVLIDERQEAKMSSKTFVSIRQPTGRLGFPSPAAAIENICSGSHGCWTIDSFQLQLGELGKSCTRRNTVRTSVSFHQCLLEICGQLQSVNCDI